MSTNTSKAPPWRRLALLGGLLLTLWLLGWATGWSDALTLESVPELVRSAGAWGALIFVLIFCAGELIHVPGVVFILAAMVIWGPVQGGVVGYIGAVASVVSSFVLVRAVGGKALTEIPNRWMARALAALDRRPVLTIALLRTVFWISPPLNYALALSDVRLRSYLVGSALGLLTPVAVTAAGFDFVRAWWVG